MNDSNQVVMLSLQFTEAKCPQGARRRVSIKNLSLTYRSIRGVDLFPSSLTLSLVIHTHWLHYNCTGIGHGMVGVVFVQDKWVKKRAKSGILNRYEFKNARGELVGFAVLQNWTQSSHVPFNGYITQRWSIVGHPYVSRMKLQDLYDDARTLSFNEASTSSQLKTGRIICANKGRLFQNTSQ